jgi:cobalt-zinc-cadmium efflux system membrane fusion protein
MSTLNRSTQSGSPVGHLPADRATHSARNPDGARSSAVKAVSVAASWIPSLGVLCLLAGVGWYGHHNGWQLPSATALIGGDGEPAPEWCESHGVAEDECINCTVGLVEPPQQSGWCGKHGVHTCPHCQPSIIESLNPSQLTAADAAAYPAALQLRPRAENVASCPHHNTRIQFASQEAMAKAGVDVEPVLRGRIREAISASGHVSFDATKLAVVSARVPGVVVSVERKLGEWVSAGELLAIVDSAEVGSAKTALLEALAKLDLSQSVFARLQPAARSGAVAATRLTEAENQLEVNKVTVMRTAQTLANLGVPVDERQLSQLPADERAEIVSRAGLPESYSSKPIGSSDSDAQNSSRGPAESANWVGICAPIDGVINSLEVVRGELVDRNLPAFEIVDTRHMWLELRIPVEQAHLVKLGQPILFEADGASETIIGKVDWISSQVDALSRTMPVRAYLDNPDGQLRNEVFGRGDVVLRQSSDAIVVPATAVQSDGNCQIVFVRDKLFFEKGRPKFFYPRSVRIGVKQDSVVEVLAGVAPGEVVVSQGSEVLRAQLLKSNLGAGCTCGH